jgi:hypothetical protein
MGMRGRYWVEPRRLQAGPYPSRDPLDAEITFVIDVTEEGELDPYPDGGVERVRLPIRDFTAPTVEEMVRILDTIDGALQQGHVVYVHCHGGRGRTGTIVGCYLVRRGLDPVAALARIAELRGDAAPSPETDDQIALVRSWRRGL